MALAGNIPVMRNYYKFLRRNPTHTKTTYDRELTGMDFLAMRMPKKDAEPTSAARWSFYLAFGIYPDHQRKLEKAFDQMVPEYNPTQEVPFHSNILFS